MSLDSLQSYFNKNFGEPKQVELITPLIPKGKTLLYGQSGVGKTYSITKHLNRNKITPLLLDFDNNSLIDEIDMYLVDGGEFVKKFNLIFSVVPSKPIRDIEKYLRDTYKYLQSSDRLNPIEKVNLRNGSDDLKDYNDRFELLEPYLDNREEYDNLYLSYENRENDLVTNVDTSSIFFVKDQVIIIDTFVKAMKHFNSVEDFERFVNRLLKLGNSVIIIAHTKRFMNSEVPDVDEEFGNHCDGRLMLNKSNLKSRPNEYWLVIEKLRGYKGEDKIFNWERS